MRAVFRLLFCCFCFTQSGKSVLVTQSSCETATRLEAKMGFFKTMLPDINLKFRDLHGLFGLTSFKRCQRCNQRNGRSRAARRLPAGCGQGHRGYRGGQHARHGAALPDDCTCTAGARVIGKQGANIKAGSARMTFWVFPARHSWEKEWFFIPASDSDTGWTHDGLISCMLGRFLRPFGSGFRLLTSTWLTPRTRMIWEKYGTVT